VIGFRPYFRRGLQRRIFMWFGISIAITTAVVMAMVGFPGNAGPMDRARQFLSDEFALVWRDPSARSDLAARVARDFEVIIEVTDENRVPMTGSATCGRHAMETAVFRDGAVVGYVTICDDHIHRRRAWLPLLIAVVMLWGASGAISRRLARPLLELSRVAQDIGRGQLKSRVRLPRRTSPEFAVVGSAINEMATRIEKQIADQRALLATVSHEIRTPLARMRLLVAIASDPREPDVAPEPGATRVSPRPRNDGDDVAVGPTAPPFALLEREILEIDTLVGDLLASSRLDFGAVTRTLLDAKKVAADALERAEVDVGRLVVPTGDTTFMGDATLVARAVSNLLENAKHHGRGVQSLRVDAGSATVTFVVEDRGDGFEPGEELRAFEPFYRRTSRPGGGDAAEPVGGDLASYPSPAPAVDGDRSAAGASARSVGLGLALVKRIAEAHDGRAFASNRPGGGAQVGIELSRRNVPLHS